MDTIQSQTPEVQPEAPSLQLSDLILMTKIIQVAAQRGAIKADEMVEVGALHNKLVAFLQSTGAIQPVSQQPPTEENQNG